MKIITWWKVMKGFGWIRRIIKPNKIYIIPRVVPSFLKSLPLTPYHYNPLYPLLKIITLWKVMKGFGWIRTIVKQDRYPSRSCTIILNITALNSLSSKTVSFLFWPSLPFTDVYIAIKKAGFVWNGFIFKLVQSARASKTICVCHFCYVVIVLIIVDLFIVV